MYALLMLLPDPSFGSASHNYKHLSNETCFYISNLNGSLFVSRRTTMLAGWNPNVSAKHVKKTTKHYNNHGSPSLCLQLKTLSCRKPNLLPYDPIFPQYSHISQFPYDHPPNVTINFKWVPSGKLPHNWWENHLIFNGKIHYFYGHVQ